MNSPDISQGQIKSIAIAGSGVTCWLAASLLARVLRGSREIVVIETGNADTPQREFATLPPLTGLHTILGIDENDLLSKTDGTFRLATKFRDWSRVGSEYFHPHGETGANFNSIAFRHYWLKLRQSGLSVSYSDFNLCAVAAQAGKFTRPSADKRSVLSTLEYAYHLDASLYASHLRGYAHKQGVRSEQGQIAGVTRNTGLVEAIVLEDGRRFEADLFLDCTGSKSQIIGTDTGIEDWSAWLPCDRAIALSTAGGDASLPCSEHIAQEAGWRWRIPLQNRVGHGFVYASTLMGDDDARSAFQRAIGSDASDDPISWKFASGRRRNIWSGNVIALGAAAATLEPLENLQIHIAQIGVTRLLALFPDASFAHGEREEYNRLMASELDRIRDFLILHYHATARSDSPFWNHCRNMHVPGTLARKITQFESRGRVVLYDEETFSEDSWASVFLGQDIMPRRYDPLADNFDTEQLKTQLQRIRSTVRQGADSMPAHAAFIRKYCAAPPSHNGPAQ